MPSTPLRWRFLSTAVTASLFVSSIGLAAGEPSAGPQWIFPGQAMPADVGYQPLRVGTGTGVEVPVVARDWFLLRNPHFTPLNEGKNGRALMRYVGPVLDDSNAQIYFRLVSGMILKETMQQMRMNAHQARQLITDLAAAGKTLDQVSLQEITLPSGLDELARQWDRPMARLAVLPYLVLPLSIGQSTSSFQHFYFGRIEDTQGQKTCSSARTVAPIGPVQAKIDERQKKLDQLELTLQNATSAYERSNRETLRLTNKVKGMSDGIDQAMKCFAAIKDRVSRGTALPDQDCINRAQQVMADAKLSPQWEKFVNVNLKNDKGDFVVRQETDIQLKTLETRLEVARNSLNELTESRDKIQSEQRSNEEKNRNLDISKAEQKKIEIRLDQDERKLNEEYQTLQAISFKLDQGTLGLEMSDADVQREVNNTSARNRRMEEIKSRLSMLLGNKKTLQANQTTIMTQVEYLARQMDTNRTRLQSLTSQIGDEKSGLMAEVARLEKDVQKMNEKFLEASDQYNFAEYVVSVLTRQLITLSQARDEEFKLLKKEESAVINLKVVIAEAQKARDNGLPVLQRELTDLRAQLANYRDPERMGWFLEDDCASRTQFDSLATGIYLSRAPMSSSVTSSGVVDGGKWGLFNLDFSHFQTPIENGVLLNLPEYLRLSIKTMIENYDAAVARYLDTSAERCPEVSTATNGYFASSVSSLMGAAFAMWNDGSGRDARVRSYCQRSEARTAYLGNLSQFLGFYGTVLDKALPRVSESQPSDLIERQAISALAQEMTALTTGSLTQADQEGKRRDQLIKALVQVLAFDYEGAIAQTQAKLNESKKYRFATQAPGVAPSAEEAQKLTVGSVQTIRNMGHTRLYQDPIAKPEYEHSETLAAQDQVRLLPVDPSRPDLAVQSGWVKVQSQKTGEEAYWMPAWVLTMAAPVDSKGQEVYDISNPKNCPLRRLVTGLTNFATQDPVITRFDANMVMIPVSKVPGAWTVSLKQSPKVSPASTEKKYVACEAIQMKGKPAMVNVPGFYRNLNGVDYENVLALRIVEVREVPLDQGGVRYIPVEDQGGYVATWMPHKNLRQPRILLGGELDAKTWSVKP